ncbi:hypothetical protein DUNSADRAFT_7344 [Dunaliella salina]|uniref:Leucine zipper transcription factor-like protein 1 n=1 Tax=Dunaliella salina TaxID=3046 RepID=A0ABQ7GLG8_DUNSA|nr:hypothetical protein DUNSADRAFT_7344 [Dunaliella salina]|eukprot:KAF5835455.1 hypothetical protein DUNSADRAFT_7344 [Dunaliella salina]
MQELHLSPENELQLQSFLRFAKLKRDQHVRETLMVIRDFQKEKLQPGEMYNHQDAVALFEEMKEEVRALVDKEIQHAYHTNGLLIKLLISQAEARGVKIAVDTNSLENEVLLRQVAKSELEALGKKPADFATSKPQIVVSAPAPENSAEHAKQIKQLQEEKAGMQERMQQLQEQVTSVMRERTTLNDTINSLKDQLAAASSSREAAQAGSSSSLAKLQEDFKNLSVQAEDASKESRKQFEEMEKTLNEHRGMLNQARRDAATHQQALKDTEAQLKTVKDSMEGKLQESVQFQQLRKLMQAKTVEVKELRAKLNKYEEVNIPSADE